MKHRKQHYGFVRISKELMVLEASSFKKLKVDSMVSGRLNFKQGNIKD